MYKQPRFDILMEKHLGLGIRWQTDVWSDFPLSLYIAVMCITMVIGIGPRKQTTKEC